MVCPWKVENAPNMFPKMKLMKQVNIQPPYYELLENNGQEANSGSLSMAIITLNRVFMTFDGRMLW